MTTPDPDEYDGREHVTPEELAEMTDAKVYDSFEEFEEQTDMPIDPD